MPGKANWKTLYDLEYRQLYEEGYPVGEHREPPWPSPYLSFLDNRVLESDLSEREWQKGYETLWKVREKGLRPGFPFIEPNDLESILNSAGDLPHLQPLDPAESAERLKGAWFGRCAGVVLGKPFEMGMNRLDIREYLESLSAYPLDDWAPIQPEPIALERCGPEKHRRELRRDSLASCRGHVRYVQPDDDVHYTILALLLAEKHGLGFTPLDVGRNLLDNVPYNWLWSATGQAYYHLVNLADGQDLSEQVRLIPTRLNPWREGINGAIRADFWGYISPGDPRRAARLAHQAVSINMVKNGLYGAMFVAGCLAAALSQHPTMEGILEGGLSAIPKTSRLAAVVEEVRTWYSQDKDWLPVCDKIYGKYGHLPFAGCLNNMALVVLALIHGQLDYTRTITTAVMCGTDTDCTAGTAGSIAGAALGFSRLDPKWTGPLNDHVKTVVAGFGEGSISGLVDRTLAVHEKWIQPATTASG
jgi:hypothetical protein